MNHVYQPLAIIAQQNPCSSGALAQSLGRVSSKAAILHRLGIRICRVCLTQKNVSVAEIRTYIDTNANRMHVKYLPRAGIMVLSQDFPMPSNCLRCTIYVHTVVQFIYTLTIYKCIRNPASSLAVPIRKLPNYRNEIYLHVVN